MQGLSQPSFDWVRVLGRLTSLLTIFLLYHGGQYYWWRKLEKQLENHRPVTSHRQTFIFY